MSDNPAPKANEALPERMWQRFLALNGIDGKQPVNLVGGFDTCKLTFIMAAHHTLAAAQAESPKVFEVYLPGHEGVEYIAHFLSQEKAQAHCDQKNKEESEKWKEYMAMDKKMGLFDPAINYEEHYKPDMLYKMHQIKFMDE